jgi:thiamine biosynthesis lipoprotein
VVDHRFRSMGCEVVVGGARAAEEDAIEHLFAARDATFSRFCAGSELNRVNAAAGDPTPVSTVFAKVLRLALEAQRETGGLVDPRLGAHVEAAGYDRDFPLIVEAAAAAPVPAVPEGGIRLEGCTILVPRGIRLDLNGVVKGHTVDEAMALLTGGGFVSAGGDIATRGEIVVSLPGGGSVALLEGALATSGTDSRRWSCDGAEAHHLIDPRTGRPSTSPWRTVTVCGASCAGADIAAKAAFLLGAGGPAWLDARGLPGRLVAADGCVTVNRAWQVSMGGRPRCT